METPAFFARGLGLNTMKTIEMCIRDRAQEVNKEVAKYVDVMIGNEEDFTACLGFEIEGNDENLKTCLLYTSRCV